MGRSSLWPWVLAAAAVAFGAARDGAERAGGLARRACVAVGAWGRCGARLVRGRAAGGGAATRSSDRLAADRECVSDGDFRRRGGLRGVCRAGAARRSPWPRMGGAVGPVGLAAPLRGADRDRVRLSRWPPALAEVAARCVRRHRVRSGLSRPELLRQRALRIALRGRRQAAARAPRRVRVALAARLPRHARRPACRGPGRARALPARHRDRAPSAQVAGLHRRAGSG